MSEKGKRSEDRGSGSRPDDHRRKWDLAEYEKAAKAREDVEKAMNRYRYNLKKCWKTWVRCPSTNVME